MKKITLVSKGGTILLKQRFRAKLSKTRMLLTLKGQKFFELWLIPDHFSMFEIFAAIQD